ncbi:metallophosphoesterase [Roseovarius mucosus]|uniref:Metallophosphoesterase n=2 Tax=Roseovarius mucosus TaxID=215743 RepID=A0A1V0RRI5_9RHOB|nr:metallophosphoesterase [Roseovarius mucosus]
MHERVGPEDQLWLLGDFALGHKKLDKNWLREMFNRLPGAEQHLIVGNHDDEIIRSLPWASVSHMAEVRDGEHRHYNTLFHYPMLTWNNSRRGAYCLFGHVHDNFLGTRNCVNVGLDVWDFYPVSFDEIEQRSKTLHVNKYWHEVEPGTTIFGEQIDYY